MAGVTGIEITGPQGEALYPPGQAAAHPGQLEAATGVGAEPMAQEADARGGGMVVARAAPRVVGMRMGDQRAVDGAPGVDVEIAGRVVALFTGSFAVDMIARGLEMLWREAARVPL